ncbi:MAG: hypothetical protein Q4G30_01865 [Actinomycetaceae bacterium]|nr:hypothetical protein [Actinomycetaceae bacterium]
MSHSSRTASFSATRFRPFFAMFGLLTLIASGFLATPALAGDIVLPDAESSVPVTNTAKVSDKAADKTPTLQGDTLPADPQKPDTDPTPETSVPLNEDPANEGEGLKAASDAQPLVAHRSALAAANEPGWSVEITKLVYEEGTRFPHWTVTLPNDAEITTDENGDFTYPFTVESKLFRPNYEREYVDMTAEGVFKNLDSLGPKVIPGFFKLYTENEESWWIRTDNKPFSNIGLWVDEGKTVYFKYSKKNDKVNRTLDLKRAHLAKYLNIRPNKVSVTFPEPQAPELTLHLTPTDGITLNPSNFIPENPSPYKYITEKPRISQGVVTGNVACGSKTFPIGITATQLYTGFTATQPGIKDPTINQTSFNLTVTNALVPECSAPTPEPTNPPTPGPTPDVPPIPVPVPGTAPIPAPIPATPATPPVAGDVVVQPTPAPAPAQPAPAPEPAAGEPPVAGVSQSQLPPALAPATQPSPNMKDQLAQTGSTTSAALAMMSMFFLLGSVALAASRRLTA